MKNFCISGDKFLYFIFAVPMYFIVVAYGIGEKKRLEKRCRFLDFPVKKPRPKR